MIKEVMLSRLANHKWNRVTAAHLANRAGFGATPETIVKLTGHYMGDIVDQLINISDDAWNLPPPEWVNEDSASRLSPADRKNQSAEERQKIMQMQRRTARDELTSLRGWWFNQMLTTPNPLLEKLTLFWHGHFATSMEKVRHPYAMYLQNQTLRKYALGNWEKMLVAISRDPAMLIYLDNAQSNKQQPNENYARELMELFTLGEGHYSEDDVKAAARAFTGWSIERDRMEFRFREPMHDNNKKTFMGKSGNLDGEDIINRILKNPEAAPYICKKLWSFFAYENPPKRVINELARILVQNQFEWKPVLRAMFTSEDFYSELALRTQIKSPVQWLVSSCRYLDTPMPDPEVAAAICELLGQRLFAPPSVKGWDGGFTWITTASLIERYNLAGVLIKGSGRKSQNRLPRGLIYENRADLGKILPQESITSNDEAVKNLLWRLFHGPLSDKDIATLRQHFNRLPNYTEWTGDDVRNLIHLLMSTPLYQLT